MMRNKLSTYLILLSSLCYGQIDGLQKEGFLFNSDLKGFNYNHKIEVGVDYMFNSNSITNSFFNSVLKGKLISNDTKKDVSDKLTNQNRIGLDFTPSLRYKWKSADTSGMFYTLSLKSRDFLNASFNRELFKLIFEGNSQYAGQHLSIAPFNFSYIRYQQLSLGQEKKFSHGFTGGLELSLIYGSQFQQIKLHEGDLFTSIDGDYIDFSTDLEVAYSNPNSSFAKMNGLGLAVGFYGNKKFNNGSQIGFEIKDIGIVSWMNLSSYHANDQYNFDGIQFDLFSLNDSLFSNTSSDSLSAILNVPIVAKQVRYLPATFHLRFLHDLSSKTGIGFGYRYMTNSNFKSQLYMLVNQKFSGHFSMGSTLSIGGFGNIDISLNLAKRFDSRYTIALNAYYLESIISPRKTTGQGFSGSFYMNF